MHSEDSSAIISVLWGGRRWHPSAQDPQRRVSGHKEFALCRRKSAQGNVPPQPWLGISFWANNSPKAPIHVCAYKIIPMQFLLRGLCLPDVTGFGLGFILGLFTTCSGCLGNKFTAPLDIPLLQRELGQALFLSPGFEVTSPLWPWALGK